MGVIILIGGHNYGHDYALRRLPMFQKYDVSYNLGLTTCLKNNFRFYTSYFMIVNDKDIVASLFQNRCFPSILGF
jgi:hypothetical protein